MGIFSNLGKTASTQGGNYIQPGIYKWEIQRVKMQEARKTFFVAELRVLESTRTDEEVTPNAVGSEVSFLVEVPGEYPEMSLGNVKAFLYPAFCVLADSQGAARPAEADIGEREAEYAMGVENPLAGLVIAGEAFHKKTKKGNLFTRVKYKVPGDEK